YSGCGTRRLTCTTIVFCILVETTGPTFSFLCEPFTWETVASAIVLLRSLPDLALTQIGQQASAILAHFTPLAQPFGLTHGHLKFHAERLLVDFAELLLHFGRIEPAQLVFFHIALLHRLAHDEPGLHGNLVR